MRDATPFCCGCFEGSEAGEREEPNGAPVNEEENGWPVGALPRNEGDVCWPSAFGDGEKLGMPPGPPKPVLVGLTIDARKGFAAPTAPVSWGRRPVPREDPNALEGVKPVGCGAKDDAPCDEPFNAPVPDEKRDGVKELLLVVVDAGWEGGGNEEPLRPRDGIALDGLFEASGVEVEFAGSGIGGRDSNNVAPNEELGLKAFKPLKPPVACGCKGANADDPNEVAADAPVGCENRVVPVERLLFAVLCGPMKDGPVGEAGLSTLQFLLNVKEEAMLDMADPEAPVGFADIEDCDAWPDGPGPPKPFRVRPWRFRA